MIQYTSFPEEFLSPPEEIYEYFCECWGKISSTAEIQLSPQDALSEMKDLVVYEALDGHRTTLTSLSTIPKEIDTSLFLIKFIHTLKTLNARQCIVMVHTSYNRERGEKEFNFLLEHIRRSIPLINEYCVKNDVRISCVGMEQDYELIDLLQETEELTKNGTFQAYCLFDYHEEYIATRSGYDALKNLPEIDVHIRHTKFNFSGGWIPGKMKKSIFLCSQNGSVYTNWKSDEIVVLIALSLLAKKLNQGEGLSRVYHDIDEMESIYKRREVELFQKVVRLRDDADKLFLFGSPLGLYQFYY